MNLFNQTPEEETPAGQLRGLFATRATPDDIQKVQEGEAFLGRMNPDNAKALLVAGLGLMSGQSFGQAGLNAFQFKEQASRQRTQDNLRQQNQRANQGIRQQQLELTRSGQEISRGNQAISRLNAQTALANSQRAAKKANDPLSTAGKVVADYQNAVRNYGKDSPEAQFILNSSNKDGLKVDFAEDGTLRGISFGGNGGGLENTKPTTNNLQEEANRLSTIRTQISGLRDEVKKASPQSFGVVGGTLENTGALLGQFGLEEAEEFVSPDTDIRTRARTVGLQLATDLINEPRATNDEREAIQKNMAILEGPASKKKAEQALDFILELSAKLEQEALGRLESGRVDGGNSEAGPSLSEMWKRSLEKAKAN